MGTTLVAAILFKGWFYAINIGDSRLYIVTRYEAKQVTKDHSFVQYLIDNGKLTPDEAKYYPRKNVITRAVGVGEKLDVDFFSAPLEPWESGYLLLCSDGLSNYADNKILVDILYGSMSRSRSSPEIDLSKKPICSSHMQTPRAAPTTSPPFSPNSEHREGKKMDVFKKTSARSLTDDTKSTAPSASAEWRSSMRPPIS